MEELTTRQLRNIQLKMLEYIDELCEKNNLKYYLIGGTLIGAVRHKGYIPWDDDVDIFMPIEDYKKLIKLINTDSKNKYLALNPYEHEDYYYFFVKMVDTDTILIEKNFNRIKNLGVFVDIFPLYKVPENERELSKYIKKIKKLEKVFFRNYGFEKYYIDKNHIRKIIKKIVYFPEHIILKGKMIKRRNKILKLIEKYENTDSELIGSVVPPCIESSVVNKRIFEKQTDVEFENLKLKAPIGYDELLRKIYGNYMELPPKEKQTAPHNFKAYIKGNENEK